MAMGGSPSVTKAVSALLIAVLFILTDMSAFGTCSPFVFTRIYLHVTNNIQHSMAPSSSTLLVHCKSRDDDLGIHYLGLNESYSFTFRPNIFGFTLFWCHMDWKLEDGREVWKDFDIYSGKEVALCTKECFWEANDYGIYKREGDVTILAYNWNI